MRSFGGAGKNKPDNHQHTLNNVNHMMDHMLGTSSKSKNTKKQTANQSGKKEVESRTRGANRSTIATGRALAGTGVGSVTNGILGALNTGIYIATNILWIIIVVGGLLVTQLIHTYGLKFQAKLQNDPKFNRAATNVVNGFIDIYNLAYQLLLVAVEIWNIALPFLSFLVYFFYAIAVKLITGIYDKVAGTPSQYAEYMESPQRILSSGTSPDYINQLVCIVLDISNLLTGLMKIALKNSARMFQAVLDWLNKQQRQQYYRNTYCNVGDTNSGGGLGPEGDCADNSQFIKSVIDIGGSISNVITNIVVMIVPIICDMLKSLFDTLIKILPEILDGLISIIELFLPGHPMGDALIQVLNVFIQIIGFMSKTCLLQLIVAIVVCVFNLLISLVVNVAMEIIYIIKQIVCLGGLLCHTKDSQPKLRFSSCSWTSVTQCFSQNFDSKPTKHVSMCVPTTCMERVYAFKNLFMDQGKHILGTSSHHPERIEQYKECVKTYSNNHTLGTKTVEAHYFCHHLSEHVHEPAPLGMDPRKKLNTFDEPHDFCHKNQMESCYCKYDSPICESQSCCISHYNILLGQMYSRYNITTCGEYRNISKPKLNAYCVSNTMRSLQAHHEHLLGSSMHCEAILQLTDEDCDGKDDNEKMNRKAILGGTCKHIDQLGFCDEKRRPTINVSRLMDPLIDLYNKQLEKLDMRRTAEGREKLKHKSKRRYTASFDGDVKERNLYPQERYMEDTTNLRKHYSIVHMMMSNIYPMTHQVIHMARRNGLAGNIPQPRLFSNYITPNGKVSLMATEVNDDWKDFHDKDYLESPNLDGTKLKWYLGDKRKDDWSLIVGSQATDASPQCTSGDPNNKYPGKDGFDCMTSRSNNTAGNTAGAIDNVAGDNGAQVKVENMQGQQTDPIKNIAAGNDGFNPIRSYGADYRTANTVNPADSTFNPNPPDGITHTWREPLSPGDTDKSGPAPGDFSLYGAGSSSDEDSYPSPEDSLKKHKNHHTMHKKSLKECPVPVDFPWEEVFEFNKELSITDRMLRHLKATIEVEDDFQHRRYLKKSDIYIPTHLSKSMNAMYGKKDLNHFRHLEVTTTLLSHLFGNITHTTMHMADAYDSWNEAGNSSDDYIYSFLRSPFGPSTLDNGSYIFTKDKKYGSGNTDSSICIAEVNDPYNCCEADTPAYRCCFGLLLCIPDLPKAFVPKWQNFSVIANATCTGPSNVISSLTVIPRLLFSKIVWDRIINNSPPVLYEPLYNLFYPIIYDKGGASVTQGLAGEFFCMLINLNYIFYVLTGFLSYSILNELIFNPIKSTKARAEVGYASVRAANALDSADLSRPNID